MSKIHIPPEALEAAANVIRYSAVKTWEGVAKDAIAAAIDAWADKITNGPNDVLILRSAAIILPVQEVSDDLEPRLGEQGA